MDGSHKGERPFALTYLHYFDRHGGNFGMAELEKPAYPYWLWNSSSPIEGTFQSRLNPAENTVETRHGVSLQ